MKDDTPQSPALAAGRRYFRSVRVSIGDQTQGSGQVTICLHGGSGNSGDHFIPYLSPLADETKPIYLDEHGPAG